MTCDYCFYCDEAKKRTQHVYGMMNEKTLETIIEKTIREADAVASFTWQGGEPTLRGIDFFEKAVALQKKYKQQYQRNNLHIMNSFQTNGYELDRQWAKFFKRNQFLVGLSIDGLPEIHDSFRKGKDGSESFFRVKQAAELLDKYQVDYNILTVVTSQVAERIKEIYPFYKKCGWNYQQYIACLEPFGENREQSRTPFRQNSTETFFQICLNCGIMIYKAQVSHILDSLKIMWDWPQDIWRNLVSKGDAAEYSMQWKQMEASIRVIFT